MLTIKRVNEILSQMLDEGCPESTGIKIVLDRKITQLDTISVGVDIDENKEYIWMMGETNNEY